MKDLRAVSFPGKPQTAEEIAARLTEAVHEHRVLPGMKLSEDEVGEVFGVGRTVVRQALRALAHEGLAQIERNRGAFVAKPTVKEAREVFEARRLLEPRTARAAAEKITYADLAVLKAHIASEHAALDKDDYRLALKLSGQFHLEIARIAEQATVEAFIRQLISRSSLVIALYWRRRTAMCESHAHDALINALEQKRGPAAEKLMAHHIDDLLENLDLEDKPTRAVSLREALNL